MTPPAGTDILDSAGTFAAAQLVPACAAGHTRRGASRGRARRPRPRRSWCWPPPPDRPSRPPPLPPLPPVRVARPVVTSIAEDLPTWVGPGTLVVALDAGVAERLVSDTTVDGIPIIAVGGDPAQRPAPVIETAAALAAIEQFGLAAGLIDEMDGAADVLTARLAELSGERSPADRLAKRIGRTMPLVYGAGRVGAAAAASWKHSVNRNAKAPAFANSVPGLDHDEVVGWAQHGDVTRQVFTLAVVRHAFETEDEAHRLDVTAETCDEIVAGVHQVTSAATTPVAALFDLMLYGELVSLEMAARADIDPGPTPVTDRYL